MAQMLGMDVQGVRALSKEMETKAAEIETIKGNLTGRLSSVQWVGNDADKFRSEWESHHARALQQVAEAVRQASQAASKNADEQEQASGH